MLHLTHVAQLVYVFSCCSFCFAFLFTVLYVRSFVSVCSPHSFSCLYLFLSVCCCYFYSCMYHLIAHLHVSFMYMFLILFWHRHFFYFSSIYFVLVDCLIFKYFFFCSHLIFCSLSWTTLYVFVTPSAARHAAITVSRQRSATGRARQFVQQCSSLLSCSSVCRPLAVLPPRPAPPRAACPMKKR